MTTPPDPRPTPVQQTVHTFLDELEIKCKAVLGTLSNDFKSILDRLHRQAHDDAATVKQQAGQDVSELKQVAADAVQAAETPPSA